MKYAEFKDAMTNGSSVYNIINTTTWQMIHKGRCLTIRKDFVHRFFKESENKALWHRNPSRDVLRYNDGKDYDGYESIIIEKWDWLEN